MSSIVNSDISKFCALVREGIDAWTKAGKLLCELKKNDPNIFTAILKHEPRLTPEILKTFERLGDGEIYAPLLVDGSVGARRLLLLPYDEQVRLHNAKVAVARLVSGDVLVEHKMIQELTESEAKRVFNGKSIRSPKEQTELLQKIPGNLTVSSKNGKSESLDDDPNETISSNLEKAQSAMISAKALMDEQNINIPALTKLYFTALNALGNLRYELSQLKLPIVKS